MQEAKRRSAANTVRNTDLTPLPLVTGYTPNSTTPFPPFSGSARKPKTALFVLAVTFNFYIVIMSVTSPSKTFNTDYFNPPMPRTSCWSFIVGAMVGSNLLQVRSRPKSPLC